MRISFTVPGRPRGKQRPRFSGHAYTPKATQEYERLVAQCYKAAAPQSCVLFSGPILVTIRARFKVPGNIRKAEREKMIAEERPYECVPDIDNVQKIILDGLNRANAWIDDSHVVGVTATKCYSAENGVDVTVEECQ